MWLSIDDKYECSINGEVRNKMTLKVLKPWIGTGGYMYSRMGGTNSIKKSVHRIVGGLFLPSPTSPDCEIDHIDRNRTNNHASNLRWVSRDVNTANRGIEIQPRKHNTLGEIYIKYYSGLYIVSICNKELKVYKSFRELNDAKDFRNHILENRNAVYGQKVQDWLACL